MHMDTESDYKYNQAFLPNSHDSFNAHIIVICIKLSWYIVNEMHHLPSPISNFQQHTPVIW